MRLGLRPTVFQPDTEWSQVRQLYGGAEMIWERHRHRYEVNPAYVDRLEAAGLRFTGKDEKGERMQVAELKGSSFPSCGSRNLPLTALCDSLQNTRTLLDCKRIPNSALVHSTLLPPTSDSSPPLLDLPFSPSRSSSKRTTSLLTPSRTSVCRRQSSRRRKLQQEIREHQMARVQLVNQRNVLLSAVREGFFDLPFENAKFRNLSLLFFRPRF